MKGSANINVLAACGLDHQTVVLNAIISAWFGRGTELFQGTYSQSGGPAAYGELSSAVSAVQGLHRLVHLHAPDVLQRY